jgi:transposase
MLREGGRPILPGSHETVAKHESPPALIVEEGGRPIPPRSKRPLRSKGRHWFMGREISHDRLEVRLRIEWQGRDTPAHLVNSEDTGMTEQSQQWSGIDISSTRLDVALYPSGVHFSVEHTEAGRAELVSKLKAYEIAGIVLEATGGLERSVLEALEAGGYQARRVNPTQVRHFAKAMGKLAKTDPIDAAMIARYGYSRQPEVTLLPDKPTQQMQSLVMRRQQLVDALTVEKNRLHSCECWAKSSIEDLIEYLETKIKGLDQELDLLSRTSAPWRERLAILTSVKGIGPVISQALLVFLPELGNRSSKTIAALVGVAPFNQDSGKFKGKRRIRGGRKQLRSLLYMAAMSAARHNPLIRDHYQQLLKRGKAKKVALIACLRKLLVILNAMLRDGKPWRNPTAPDLEAAT